jgi:hypothetical protein
MSKSLEIKYVCDTEIWIGENVTHLIEGKIIYIICVGEQTTEMANAHIKVNNQLFNMVEGKVYFLIDLNKCGKSSPEARQIWNQLSEIDKTAKVAIFGIHPVARVLASFVISLSKRNNQRFFKTKEESLQWLLE